jgi:hypothetical protein
MRVAHDERSGLPLTVEVNDQIYQRIRDNRSINADEISSKMSNSHGKKIFKKDFTSNLKYFVLINLRNWWTTVRNKQK